jgi:hypothetical protein
MSDRESGLNTPISDDLGSEVDRAKDNLLEGIVSPHSAEELNRLIAGIYERPSGESNGPDDQNEEK